MEPAPLRRNIFQRLFGICATKPPADPDCWSFQDGKLAVDLGRAPELAEPGQAVRLEAKGLPQRLLIVHKPDGRYRAFKNRCTHGGRRLDPVPGADQLQCCSIGRSTYDDAGRAISGPARGPITEYAVRNEEGTLIIEMEA